MAIKMFKCEICGEEVTKPQSYSLGDGKGRACRKHEEAQSARVLQVKRDESVRIRRQTETTRFVDRGPSARDFKNKIYQCHCCDKRGYYQDAVRPLLDRALAIAGHAGAINDPVKRAAMAVALKPDIIQILNENSGENLDSFLIAVEKDKVDFAKVLPYHRGFVKLAGLAVLCEQCFTDVIIRMADKIVQEHKA